MRPPRPIVLLLVVIATARVLSIQLLFGVPYSDAARLASSSYLASSTSS
jgi:hypothetical protein